MAKFYDFAISWSLANVIKLISEKAYESCHDYHLFRNNLHQER